MVVLSPLNCVEAAESESPDGAAREVWAFHGQATLIQQFHPAFRSSYRGRNSLDASANGRETINVTGYAGVSPWQGGEAWADLELDQGFGLSDTLGLAAFTNGVGSKVGKAIPYLRLHRLFFRQSFDLGDNAKAVAPAGNQLALNRSEDNLILTFGKFSASDVFDTNDLAHDPMRDFMNWAIIDAGPWDYAADAWGYTYGIAAEWNTGPWSFRSGLFDLSRIPNGTELVRGFGQYQLDGEIERRFTIHGHEGQIRLLGFASRGRLGNYWSAVAHAVGESDAADITHVRSGSWKTGLSLNLQQGFTDDFSVFARLTYDDPSREGDEFTDMANSMLVGGSLKGSSWNRSRDVVGLGVETGGIGRSAQSFFAHGGLGILIGDGRLDHYGRENVLEAYYSALLAERVQATLDYQFIANPAYNADRGPVSVFGLRLHADL